MRISKFIVVAVALVASAVRADASSINFKALADNFTVTGYGESAWLPLSMTVDGITVTITAKQGASTVYSYFDSNNAGLGVCGAVTAGAPTNVRRDNGGNICNPSGDDNITNNESLTLSFSQAVTINELSFNNNHDGDKSLLNNVISIGGSNYTFLAGGFMTDSKTTSPYSVAAATPFVIAFVPEAAGGDQFYLSAMTFTAVPDAGSTLSLVGLGLVGLGLLRQRLQ